MGHGDYERLTPEAIDQVWVRMRAGQAAKPTARQLGLCTGMVRAYLIRCGGIKPQPPLSQLDDIASTLLEQLDPAGHLTPG